MNTSYQISMEKLRIRTVLQLVVVVIGFLLLCLLCITAIQRRVSIDAVYITNTTDSSVTLLFTQSLPHPISVRVVGLDRISYEIDWADTNDLQGNIAWLSDLFSQGNHVKTVTLSNLIDDHQYQVNLSWGPFNVYSRTVDVHTARTPSSIAVPSPIYGKINTDRPTTAAVIAKRVSTEGVESAFTSSILTEQGTYLVDTSLLQQKDSLEQFKTDHEDTIEMIILYSDDRTGEIYEEKVSVDYLEATPLGDITLRYQHLILSTYDEKLSLINFPQDPGSDDENKIHNLNSTENTRLSSQRLLMSSIFARTTGEDGTGTDKDNPFTQGGGGTYICELGETEDREESDGTVYRRECIVDSRLNLVWSSWWKVQDQNADPSMGEDECSIGQPDRERVEPSQKCISSCERSAVTGLNYWGVWECSPTKEAYIECELGDVEEKIEGSNQCTRECISVGVDKIWSEWRCNGKGDCVEGEVKSSQSVSALNHPQLCTQTCIMVGSDLGHQYWVWGEEECVDIESPLSSCADRTTQLSCSITDGCVWNGRCIAEGQDNDNLQNTGGGNQSVCLGSPPGYYCESDTIVACGDNNTSTVYQRCEGGCIQTTHNSAVCADVNIVSGDFTGGSWDEFLSNYDTSDVNNVIVDATNYIPKYGNYPYCVLNDGHLRYISQGSSVPGSDESQISHKNGYNAIDIVCTVGEPLSNMFEVVGNSCSASCLQGLGCAVSYSVTSQDGSISTVRSSHTNASYEDDPSSCNPDECTSEKMCSDKGLVCGQTGTIGAHLDFSVGGDSIGHPCDYIIGGCFECNNPPQPIGIASEPESSTGSFLKLLRQKVYSLVGLINPRVELQGDVVAAEETIEDDAQPEKYEPGVYVIQAGNVTTKTVVIINETYPYLFYDYDKDGIQDEDEPPLTFSEANAIKLDLEKTASTILEYNFSKGFNFISIPLLLQQSDTPTTNIKTASDLIKELVYQGVEVVEVAVYRGGFRIYKENVNKEGLVVGYGEDFDLIPGEGIIIKVLNDRKAYLYGRKPLSALPIDLVTSWNLVGLYKGEGVEWSSTDVLTDINDAGIVSDLMSEYKNGRYNSYVVEDGSEYGFPFDIDEKKAYWVRVRDDPGVYEPE